MAPRTLLLAALVAACPALAGERVIDLTHPFDEKTIYWPTAAEGFVLVRGAAGRTPGGYWYEAHAFRAPEHGGTHLDAPAHFHEKGDSVEEIPLERLVAEGVVVDVAEECVRDRDHRVSIADLRRHEEKHGRIPEGAIVLLRTGFGRFWPDRARYLGTAERGEGAVAKLHFPGLGAKAARWLAAERSVGAVGIDTASIDPGPSRRFPAHVALFERNVPALENLANLDRLPAKGFRVVALPMKIRDGSGAPLRAVAIVEAP